MPTKELKAKIGSVEVPHFIALTLAQVADWYMHFQITVEIDESNLALTLNVSYNNTDTVELVHDLRGNLKEGLRVKFDVPDAASGELVLFFHDNKVVLQYKLKEGDEMYQGLPVLSENKETGFESIPCKAWACVDDAGDELLWAKKIVADHYKAANEVPTPTPTPARIHTFPKPDPFERPPAIYELTHGQRLLAWMKKFTAEHPPADDNGEPQDCMNTLQDSALLALNRPFAIHEETLGDDLLWPSAQAKKLTEEHPYKDPDEILTIRANNSSRTKDRPCVAYEMDGAGDDLPARVNKIVADPYEDPNKTPTPAPTPLNRVNMLQGSDPFK
ncbi:hypothetical protein DXG01_014599 [Tephrocybe rancida]|nr:hypothetical protein DXG01_014599 [Tephrocybe rancida]